MIIYQIHGYSGQWEDYCDRIVGSYLRKERAEEEKIKAETKERELKEHNEKCFDCPFLGDFYSNLNNLLIEYPDYCTKVAELTNDDGIIDCSHYCFHWDDETFEIKEVEVEE
jgi:hypothetical protein